MKSSSITVYAAAGCVGGVLAGIAVQAAGSSGASPGGLVLAAVAGVLASAPGAVAGSVKKSFPLECAAGLALGAVGLVAGLALQANQARLTPGTVALTVVLFVLAFSAIVAAVHAHRIAGPKLVLAAAVFGGMAGLIALALTARLAGGESRYSTAALIGGVYGGLLWGATGLVRRLFAVDVGAFKVQHPPSDEA